MYREQIQKGITLLNQKNPGWYHLINLDILKMSSLSQCVLGQVYYEFDDGVKALEIDEGPNGPHYYGFDIIKGACDYTLLTQEWREEIQKLQQNQSPV